MKRIKSAIHQFFTHTWCSRDYGKMCVYKIESNISYCETCHNKKNIEYYYIYHLTLSMSWHGLSAQKSQSVLPLKSSVQRRVEADRSVIDLRSVGISWAFTYSTNRIKWEKWLIRSFYIIRLFQTMAIMCILSIEDPIKLLVCSSTYCSLLSSYWGWKNAWHQDHLPKCLEYKQYDVMIPDVIYFFLNRTCFSSTLLWVAVEKTQT